MKKLVMLLMASLLVASTAFAVVDEDPDMLGVYFDLTADTACLEDVAPYTTIATYVIMTNPSFDMLYGVEFGYDKTDNLTVLSTDFTVQQVTDVGSPGNHIVGFGAPQECSEATVIATMSVLYLETTGAPASISLTGSNPSSIDPMLPTVLMAGGELMTLGTSTLPGEASAIINGACEDVVATDSATFGAVKSLYR
jgi:hypothetical protein